MQFFPGLKNTAPNSPKMSFHAKSLFFFLGVCIAPDVCSGGHHSSPTTIVDPPLYSLEFPLDLRLCVLCTTARRRAGGNVAEGLSLHEA